MDVIAWALVPVAGTCVAAAAAVVIVVVALRGTAARERATVLKAIADVIRAIRGSRS
ncbi:hypothetical protein ACWD3J_45755 [Streptomyces sp. NPDC002755]|uniref:hypothetical protein n=1 Tax=Streptomyces sp. NPDC002884 TaxID=3154544 RepID=UPI00332FEF99